MRLIKFKPTHNAFRALQSSYVDGRIHLTDLIKKESDRLAQVREDLAKEALQFEAMCSQFMVKDDKITDSVIEDAKDAKHAALYRKREIENLFT